MKETNPNPCDKCQWKTKHTKRNNWCYWWFTEPDVECLYDKGTN